MAFTCVVHEQINAPPEAVFAVASDFPNAAQRIRGISKMEMLTPGPVGVGTRFRETRVMFGREATETMEVVAFQPGRSYTLRASNCGCEYRTVVSVRPAAAGDGGSEVTFDFTGAPLTFGAKVMAALMGWMVKGACLKAIRQDLADLKTEVENAARG
ncbi:MAG: SRPBCC family protein [Phycisphaerae bacterium]|nr:SRPBCC family protein [Phycisphaerae bacterium]MCZ2400883.1 SRPBCC family protein [Phycisphaerae bacterium]NUQ48926.1 SRPBCC family protein [Phycisphaerae bacterium]